MKIPKKSLSFHSFWMALTPTARRLESSVGLPHLHRSSVRGTSSGSSFTPTSQVPVRDSCFSGRQLVIKYLPPHPLLDPPLPVRKPLYQREYIFKCNEKIHFVQWNLQQFKFFFTESLIFWFSFHLKWKGPLKTTCQIYIFVCEKMHENKMSQTSLSPRQIAK